ncbi:HemK2/MTQ2 family protein methyltransferase [Streptomyces sp. NPDC091387]|uniref:HemK2/MTQ2 family protein methyltransferase n=1 Tax=Streptomyces sp. NPDC091387 TaxID=3365998 RepID=UPI003810E6D6
MYRPQTDTWLLIQALYHAGIPSGARVLDMCTGTGALAIAAAGVGAGHVTAVDISRRATLATRFNARVRGLPIRVERRDALSFPAARQFDVILANPPYVPAPQEGLPRSGPSRAWDAARDGRALLDPLCVNASGMLSSGGMLLVVHSAVCGVGTTVDLLHKGGLKAAVVARRTVPFGPVMNRRIPFLEEQGFIRAGQRHEELVVIRGDRRNDQT